MPKAQDYSKSLETVKLAKLVEILEARSDSRRRDR